MCLGLKTLDELEEVEEKERLEREAKEQEQATRVVMPSNETYPSISKVFSKELAALLFGPFVDYR